MDSTIVRYVRFNGDHRSTAGLYEDLSKGLLTEERFATLSVAYEAEQRELKAKSRNWKPR